MFPICTIHEIHRTHRNTSNICLNYANILRFVWNYVRVCWHQNLWRVSCIMCSRITHSNSQLCIIYSSSFQGFSQRNRAVAFSLQSTSTMSYQGVNATGCWQQRKEKPPMMSNRAFQKLQKSLHAGDNDCMYVCQTCEDVFPGYDVEMYWGSFKEIWHVFCDHCMKRWRSQRRAQWRVYWNHSRPY